MENVGIKALCNQIKELMRQQGKESIMVRSAESDDQEYDYIFSDHEGFDREEFIIDSESDLYLACTYDYTLQLGGIILEDDTLNGYLITTHEKADDGEFLSDSYAIEDIEDLMDTMKYKKYSFFMVQHTRWPFDPYSVLKFYIDLLSKPEKFTSLYSIESDE